MSIGINTVGTSLPIGNLASVPTVAIGVGGVLTVNNTTATPSVSIAGPVTSTGPVTVPGGTATAPGLTFATATSGGLSATSATSISMSVQGAAVQNWGTAGPVTTTRSQQWTTGAIASVGSGTALTFTTPAATPAALTGYLTYAQSAVNGDTWTINQGGLWAIKTAVNATSAAATEIQSYITNGGAATTLPTIAALTPAVLVDYVGSVVPTGAANGIATSGGAFFLPAGAVIRVHATINNAAGVTITTAANVFATFTFVGATATSL